MSIDILAEEQEIVHRIDNVDAWREDAEKYKAFLDESSDPIIAFDRECRFSYVNKAYEAIVGLSREQIIGRRPEDIFAPEEAKRRSAAARWVLQYGEVKEIEARMEHPDGDRYYITTGKPIRNAANEIVSVLCVGKDITERRKSIDALRESEAMYHAMFEKNQAVKLLIDPTSGSIVDANTAAAAYYGYSLAELNAMRIGHINILTDEDVQREMEKAWTEQRLYFNFQHRLASGVIRDVEVYSSPIDIGGRTLLHSIIHDITERKQAETALLQTNERLHQAEADLKLSNAQLHQLSEHLQEVREDERSMIAREVHDELGQLFTALKLEVMALLREMASDGRELHPKTYSIMQTIETGIRTVQNLSARLRPRILDDLGLISAIIWQAEDFQRRTGIEVRLDLPSEETVIRQDLSTAIFRIVQEALTNIMRYAEATAASVTVRVGEGEIVFTIEDNGIGITVDKTDSPLSFGLIGIRERLRTFGGSVAFGNNSQGGMSIHARVPLGFVQTGIL